MEIIPTYNRGGGVPGGNCDTLNKRKWTDLYGSEPGTPNPQQAVSTRGIENLKCHHCNCADRLHVPPRWLVTEEHNQSFLLDEDTAYISSVISRFSCRRHKNINLCVDGIVGEHWRDRTKSQVYVGLTERLKITADTFNIPTSYQ